MATEWNHLRDLFEGALARPVQERAAFLSEHTSGDTSLRREIESLLDAHEAANQCVSDPLPAARLEPGIQLGAFEIVACIGSGGMGEVYRARDPRLDRFVAIKVLSTDVDTAVRGRARFEREARAISRLSHPHICTVHDLGVAERDGRDIPYLVMELLDGETLATHIARGRLSIQQSLAYAIDIADALVAAHTQGIVHRDLKPANVMVTRTGVKLLDFGLAQLRLPDSVAAASVDGSRQGWLTSAGMVFGTLPYMSPEQLRGEQVDTRTDVFALGAVLHEMLTGRQPFAADSQAALIATILEHDAPRVSDFQPLASADLDRIVHKCLAKSPDDRWQTVRDLKSELIWVREGRTDAPHARRSVTVTARRRWLMPVLVGVTVVAISAAAATIGWRWRIAPAPARVPASSSHLSHNFLPGVTLFIPINGTSFTISPDGSRIAYIGVREDGNRSLFVHTLNNGKTVDIPETRDATNPTFSPDSQWLAFVQAGRVNKLPAAGGPIQLVCECPAGQTTWISNDRIVRGGGLRPIQEVGVNERPLTRLAPGDESHATPVLLPDGSLLFTAVRGGWLSTRNNLSVWPPNGTEAHQLVANATTPQLLGSDTLVFAQGRSLVAAGFDRRTMQLVGEPHALDLQVQTASYSAAPMYALAANGTLVYAQPAAGRRLVWIDRGGREEFVKTPERMYSHFRVSPDGTRVAAYQADGDRDLWVYALDGSLAQKLTSGPERDAMPVWSADSSHIFFTTGERNIYRVPSDLSTGPVLVFQLTPPGRVHPLSMAPDGKRLLTHWDQLPKSVDLRILDFESTPTLTRLAGQSGTERDGQLSPDGRWLAYQTAESSDGHEGQIAVRPFPDTQSRRWIISPGVGRQPLWSHDGHEIFYRTEDGTVMSVPVQTTPSFEPGSPVPVITPVQTVRDWANGPTYGVSRDGRRFLFIKAPEVDIRSLNVVLNWNLEVSAALDTRK